ncbi:MAG: T9SS C-terminal target domain-containing protein [Cytophagales bacterium]|nr:MAG: T9SS C-terminal target domain-containing protein [Cytophagales bacterium]
MKKLISLIMIGLVTWTSINAQTAKNLYESLAFRQELPDKSYTDCETGVTKSIHGTLNQGKVIIVTKAPTWCPYCKVNIKAAFGGLKVAEILKKHQGKIEVWAGWDGPTNCNGAINVRNNEVSQDKFTFTFVDNNGEDAYFPEQWCSGGCVVLDPKTKKCVWANRNDGTPEFGMQGAITAAEQIVNGTFVYPDQQKNVALYKPLVNNPAVEDQKFKKIGNFNDGVEFTYAKFKGVPEVIVDLGKSYNVTGFFLSVYWQPLGYIVSVSENTTGPWTTIGNTNGFGDRNWGTVNGTGKGRYARLSGKSIQDVGELKIFSDDVTANEEVVANNQMFNVFPNPSFGEVNLNLPTDEFYQISVEDISGRNVYKSTELYKSGQSINLTHLDKGVYIINAQTNSNKLKTKLVLE